jgi:hypothetical protein
VWNTETELSPACGSAPTVLAMKRKTSTYEAAADPDFVRRERAQRRLGGQYLRRLRRTKSAPEATARKVLMSVGFTPAELADLSVIAESQETVDREYEGSWYYAMR